MTLVKKCRHGRGLTGRKRLEAWLRCGCTWTADLTTPDGRRYLNVGSDHTFAERRHEELTRDLATGAALPQVESVDGGNGFAAVARRWLAVHSPTVRTGTLRGYQAAVKIASKAFAGTPVAAIKSTHLGKLEAKLLGEDYARGTVSNIRMVVGMILTHAVTEGLIDQAPKPPRSRSRTPQPRPTVVGPADMRRVLARLDGDYADVTEFAYLTGLRRGEVLALTGRDVVRGARPRVVVSKTLHPGGVEGPTKNGKTRDVDLTDRALALIPKGTGRLWPGVKHDPWRVRLRDALLVEGLPHERPIHMLRHSNTALRLMAGQNIAYVSLQLGHGDSGFTLRRYGHHMPDARSDDTAKLASAAQDLTPFGPTSSGGSTGGA